MKVGKRELSTHLSNQEIVEAELEGVVRAVKSLARDYGVDLKPLARSLLEEVNKNLSLPHLFSHS